MDQTTKQQPLFEFDDRPNGDQYRARRVPVKQRGLVGEDYTARQGTAAYTFGTRKQAHAQEGQKLYRNYGWAYAALSRVARDVGNLPLILKRESEPDGDEVRTGPLWELLKRPNPIRSSRRLRIRTLLHMLTSGNAFWLLDSGNPTFTGMVREIWTLQPEAMRPVPDKDTVLGGWAYDPGGGKVTFLPASAVIHFSIEDPSDLLLGMSLFEPMHTAVQSAIAQQKFNQKYFENDATPGAVIEVPEVLSEDNYRRLKQELFDSRAGAEHAHEPWLLEGGMKLAPYQPSHKDMDFVNLERVSREIAFGVTGVPPAIAGDWREMNFAQSEAQIELYWTMTALPIAIEFCDTLNTFLVPRVQSGLEVHVDTSDVKVLQPDLMAQLDRKIKRIEHGLATPNEILEEEGHDTYPEGDVHYMLGSLREVGAEPEPDPFMEPDPEDTARSVRAMTKSAHALEREMIWKAFDQRLTKWERRVQRTWQDEINRVVRHVDRELRKIETPKMLRKAEGDEPLRLVLPLPAHAYLPEYDTLVGEIHSRTRQVVADMIEEFGEVAAREITTNAAFDSQAPAILRLIENTRIKDGSAVYNLLQDIRGVLEEGMAEGETIGMLSERVRQAASMDDGARARRIARTESGASANNAKVEAYRQQGVERIRWITSRDNDVRDSHIELDGKEVNVGTETFANGLYWPHDPDGPAAEVINCRCTAARAASALVDAA